MHIRHKALSNFMRAMESIAPLSLADRSWDNVGLLLESPTVVDNPCRVLLTVDLTEPVYNEAVNKGISIILAYHPPWFRGEKSLTLDQSRGMMRMVTLCAASGISIYSPHSALDAIRGGVNDHVVDIITDKTFEKSVPIQSVSNGDNDCGVGRIVSLTAPESIRNIVKRWCEYVKIPNLRVALPDGVTLDDSVDSIAVCVGSGATVLNGAEASLYFTGEMSHHEILKANIAHNAAVILTEHTNCERGFLRDVLRQRLVDELEKSDTPFEICVSKVDRDPIEIVSV
ncbi:Nif3p [Paramicrosporidium saccamoebae]|uniref:Nif3p n=1 Tax=Paramicrosporidium saccamoebae TaxID=1246581 RepID=A0A2H9TPX9_9FUNG|nr:Nif3p [Paramicrosporidium saccamoebae]